MSEFFKAEDFDNKDCKKIDGFAWMEAAAHYANKKLEELGTYIYYDIVHDSWVRQPSNPTQHSRALMLPSEVIKVCEHPKEKVTEVIYYQLFNGIEQLRLHTGEYICECSIKVFPASFKAVDE